MLRPLGLRRSILPSFASLLPSSRSFFWRKRSLVSSGEEVDVEGLLGVRGLNHPGDFSRLAEASVSESRNTLKEWKGGKGKGGKAFTAKESVKILDGVSNSLCVVADAAEVCRNVHHDPQWIEESEKAISIIASFMASANVDRTLYDAATLAEAKGEGEEDMTDEERKILSAMVTAMEHEGVHLEKNHKHQLLSLQEGDAATSEEILRSSGGGPEGVWVEKELVDKEAPNAKWKGEEGGKVFLLRGERGNVQLLSRIELEEVRKALWGAQHYVDESSAQLVKDLISTRDEMAQIRGYPSWVQYARRESVLGKEWDKEAIFQFLGDTWRALLPGLKRELDELETMKRVVEKNLSARLEPWDIDWISAQWKEANIPIDKGEIRHFITLPSLLSASERALDLSLGVKLKKVESPKGVWLPDVHVFDVEMEGGRSGVLYLDPFERPAKAVSSAQFTVAGSKIMPDGTRQTPRTALSLSLPPTRTAPLSQHLAVTFFHELGHAMHSLLSQTELQHFSGSRGCVDFVEFPSHLFEMFIYDPRSLKVLFPEMPSVLVDDVFSKYRYIFGHIELAQQLAYALNDQVVYSGKGTGGMEELVAQLPTLPGFDNARLFKLVAPPTPSSFGHLVHYGGSYYCYLLCRAMAADVWAKGFSPDPFNRASGERLRRFLEGGSVDQSLERIYSVVEGASPPTPQTGIPIEPMMEPLRTSALF